MFTGKFLAASLLAFAGAPLDALVAASPTPNLASGSYDGKWSILAVADPTLYSRNTSAKMHPIVVRYDARSETYTLNDGSTDYTFAKEEIVASKTTSAYTFYRDSATGSTLKLLNQSASNPVIALTYVTYGNWTIKPTAPILTNQNYVVFGSKTPAASMPRSGSATYGAIIDGLYHNSSGNYVLSGKASFTANFASNVIGVSVTPVGKSASGSVIQFGTMTGSGYIDSATASFTAQTAYFGNTRFASQGNFYGPKASEIGGVFTLTSKDGGAGAGAFVGKQ